MLTLSFELKHSYYLPAHQNFIMTRMMFISAALVIALIILVVDIQQASSSQAHMFFLSLFVLRPDFASSFLPDYREQLHTVLSHKACSGSVMEESHRELAPGGSGD